MSNFSSIHFEPSADWQTALAFSKHAVERIKDRHLDKETINFVLDEPDSILPGSECKQVYQKLVKEEDSTYLYRIFVNTCKESNVVITAYKTSKIDKYEY